MSRKNILDYLAYVAVRILICIVQAMPLETGRKLARALRVADERRAAHAGQGGR